MTTLHDLADRWPNDNGDPPDTDYQRGYMAACRDCAAELRAALAETGWRSMDDCPSDFRMIWVWSDGQVTPARADGDHYRWCLREGLKRTPTMWHPCEMPPPPPGAQP